MKNVDANNPDAITALDDRARLIFPSASLNPHLKPHRCPICHGNGFVPNGFYNTTNNTYTTKSTLPEPCRSCDGAGVIWG